MFAGILGNALAKALVAVDDRGRWARSLVTVDDLGFSSQSMVAVAVAVASSICRRVKGFLG